MAEAGHITFPDQFPERLSPHMVIDIPHPKDVSGFEDEVAYVLNNEYNESLWAARVALLHLMRPENFHGPLRDISMTILSEPIARLVDAQSRGSGFKFFNDAGDLTRTDARVGHFDSTVEVIGMTMKAMAHSRGAELAPVELDIWYGREAPSNVPADETTGIYRIVAAPRYDDKKFKDSHKAAKKRGSTIRQGVAGKVSTHGKSID